MSNNIESSKSWFMHTFEDECDPAFHHSPPIYVKYVHRDILAAYHQFVAKRLVEDLETATAFGGARKLAGKKWTDLIHHARYMHEEIVKIGAKKGLELGTASGQGLNIIATSLAPRGTVFSCDTRMKNMDIASFMVGKYAYHTSSTVNVYHSYSTSSKFVTAVMGDGEKIDVLFVDSDHTRKNVIEELIVWLPHLSEKAVIFFHDTLWCHDMVKVLLDEIVNNFRTYKFCRDFDIEKYTMRNFTVSTFHDTTAGIDPMTMRPTIQDPCPHAPADAPNYAATIRINPDDYLSSDKNYNSEFYELKYEMLLAWPGLIALQKSPNFSWTKMLNVLIDIQQKDRSRQ